MNGFGVAVFVTVSCGCSRVVVAVPVLFALFGSVVPAGGFAVALFVIDVPLVGAVALIVNVTVAPLASVVIVLVTDVAFAVTPPHVATVAVHKLEDKIVPIDAGIEVRKRMNLSLSCDHRVVDGWDAASFMQTLKAYIENPVRLLSA